MYIYILGPAMYSITTKTTAKQHRVPLSRNPTYHNTVFSLGSWRLRLERLNVPNGLAVLLNAAVAGEEAHPADAGNALVEPAVLILEVLVDEVLGLDVRLEVVADEVEVACVVAACVSDIVVEGVNMDDKEKRGMRTKTR